jgi:hypothetical protein
MTIVSQARTRRKRIQELSDIIETISDHGLKHLLIDAQYLAEGYPLVAKKVEGVVISLADRRAAR